MVRSRKRRVSFRQSIKIKRFPLRHGQAVVTLDYADLATILKAVTPVLSKYEIAVIQRLQEGAVETMLVHSSGEMISSLTPIPTKQQQSRHRWRVHVLSVAMR